ncbi:hypothetical protein FRB98_001230 [Tulasnella sp. 332]|nr:hypothetical protein FRB98_001230 [Tulasnella sp. 332]
MHPLAKEKEDILFFLVSQSEAKVIKSYLKSIPIHKWLLLDNITCIPSPPPHKIYSTWGIWQLTILTLFSSTTASKVRPLWEKDIKNTKTHDLRWLSSGAFVIDKGGTFEWGHIAKGVYEVSDLKGMVSALRPH